MSKKPFLYRIFPADKHAELLATAADLGCISITNMRIVHGAECTYGGLSFSVGILNARKRVCLAGIDDVTGAFGWWSTRRVYDAVMARKKSIVDAATQTRELSKKNKVANAFIEAGLDPDYRDGV